MDQALEERDSSSLWGRVLNPFKNSVTKVDTSSDSKVYLPILQLIHRQLLLSDHVASALDHVRLSLLTSSPGFLRAALSSSVELLWCAPEAVHSSCM